MDTRADAIVPTTKAPYEPLKKAATKIKRKVSRNASAYLARSNFQTMNTKLKKTSIPTNIYSIKTPLLNIVKPSDEDSI